MDIDAGKTDIDGDNCRQYSTEDCGEYDDADFKSNTMCCVCGGGKVGNILKYSFILLIWNNISFIK